MPNGPFQLIVRRDGAVETHAFHQDVVNIGRGRDCDLVLPDRLVSRLHCRVERLDGGAFVLVDAGAQNPARLRGKPVARAEIRAGDAFALGGCEITLALPPTLAESAEETKHGDLPEKGREVAAFLRIARALNESRDLTRLLTQIVDEAIALCGAERGFLLLGKPGEHTVEVARNFAQEEIGSPEFKMSRGLADRVLRSGLPELTTNAQQDDRFRDLQSVADLRLRSVLCIPIRVAGAVAGAIYVDNRLQQQVFQEREKALLLSLADHAGTAIQTARFVAQLQQQQAELHAALARVDELNAALKGQLQERTTELQAIRDDLRAQAPGARGSKYAYPQITGDSRAMRAVFALLDKYVDADDPVLITGASGTGKELVARAVHHNGRRANRPFVSENCAALPEALLESELFGHVKGAFTGATANKKGLFEAADGGVLFLDEVGDLPLELQKKLLRVLQEGEVRPLGGRDTVKVNVRLIAATNRDLVQMVRDGEFREDLYYRLAVLPVHLPPLRDRREDVPALVRRFLAELPKDQGRVRIAPEALERLVAYPWPGNVRELQNELRRAAVVCDGVILEAHLSPHVREGRAESGATPAADAALPAERGTTLPDMVRDLEVREVQKAFARAQGNKSRAAELLGLSRFALQRKLDKYALDGEGRPTGKPPAPDADG
jgi:transcriptional regulator with GAF, ATPase, and Fis domain